MTTPGSRTIRECPECQGPCLFYNPDYGSIYLSDGEELCNLLGFYEGETHQCPHCLKDFLISNAEISCIYFLDEFKANLLQDGMEINKFIEFLGINAYGKIYTKYKLYQNIRGRYFNEYDAYYVAFKALPEDYFLKVKYSF